MNWTNQIADCIEHGNMLKGISLVLIATTDYVPDCIYWLEYFKANAN